MVETALSGLCRTSTGLQYVRHSLILLFADDTKCLSPISSILDCQLLQSDLDQLSTWSSDWSLLFNESKCSLISFTSGSSRNASSLLPYYINNCEVVACSYHKDLGITMSHDLSWSKHITQITCKNYSQKSGISVLLEVFGCGSVNT